MTDAVTLASRLAEAELARHKLLTGTMVITLDFGDVGSTTYKATDIDKLEAYIASLRSQLSASDGIPENRRRPIHLTF